MNSTVEESLDTKEWAGVAATRSQVFGFLGSLYRRLPDEQFVEGLLAPETEEFLNCLAQAEELPQEVREGALLVKRFAEDSRTKPIDELKTKINVERTRLFRGIKPGYGPRPPYESVYADSSNKEVDPYPMAAVAKAYAEAEAVLPTENYDQPDYIGFELDFMRHLYAKESAAWERGDVEQAMGSITKEQSFLNDHLVRWVPHFCDEMSKDAQLDLYQGVARITRGLVLDETQKSAAYQELAHTAWPQKEVMPVKKTSLPASKSAGKEA